MLEGMVFVLGGATLRWILACRAEAEIVRGWCAGGGDSGSFLAFQRCGVAGSPKGRSSRRRDEMIAKRRMLHDALVAACCSLGRHIPLVGSLKHEISAHYSLLHIHRDEALAICGGHRRSGCVAALAASRALCPRDGAYGMPGRVVSPSSAAPYPAQFYPEVQASSIHTRAR